MSQPTDDLGVTSTDSPRTPKGDEDMESMSTSLPKALADKVRARAEEEDRTIAVILRRATKAYMKGWEPGQDDD